MGVQLVGGVPVGMSEVLSAEEFGRLLSMTKITILFIDSESFLELLMRVLKKLDYQRLFAVVCFNTLTQENVTLLRNQSIYGFAWRDFVSLAGTDDSTLQRLVRRRWRTIEPGMCAAIVATPGSGGLMKAAMLSHDNLCWTGTIVAGIVGAQPSDRIVSYIPLSTVYGLLFDLVGAIVAGYTVSFANHSAMRGSLGDILREVQPTFFAAMPHVLERIRTKAEGVESAISEESTIRSTVLRWSQGVGRTGLRRKQEGKSLPWGWSIAKLSTFAPFLSKLGLSSARLVITLGGPVSRETVEFYESMGLQLYETYGCTETTGVASMSLPDAVTTGTAGRRLLGTGLTALQDRNGMVDETGAALEQEYGDGELWVRGRHVFMGYLNAPREALAQQFDASGWFNTLDYGRFDGGFVIVDGPVDELITLRSGARIVPHRVEARARNFLPGIEHVLVFGSGEAGLGALLSPRTRLNRSTGAPTPRLEEGPLCDVAISAKAAAAEEAAAALAANPAFEQSDSADVPTTAEVLGLPAVLKFVQACVDAYNSATPEDAQIHSWAIVPTPLTVFGGELDTMHKPKRGAIRAKYSELIDSLFGR